MCVLGGKEKGNYGDREKERQVWGNTHTAQKDKGRGWISWDNGKEEGFETNSHTFYRGNERHKQRLRVKGVSRRRISRTERHEIRQGARVISSVSWKTGAAGKRRETHTNTRACWEIGKGDTHMELFASLGIKVNRILVKSWLNYKQEIWRGGLWMDFCYENLTQGHK